MRPALGATTVPCPGRSPPGTIPLLSSCSRLDFGGGQSYRVSLVRNGESPPLFAPPVSNDRVSECTLHGPGRGRKYRPHYPTLASFPSRSKEKNRVSSCPFGPLVDREAFPVGLNPPSPCILWSTTGVYGLGSYIIQNPFRSKSPSFSFPTTSRHRFALSYSQLANSSFSTSSLT